MKDRIDQIIDMTARTESGGSYTAWNENDNGHGVSVGLIQFNQKRGLLPGLLQAMARVDGLSFHQRAPRYGLRLLNMSWVSEADLNEPTVKAEILALLGYGPFQQVQRDLARTEYFTPAWKAAQEHGLTSERWAALLFDTAVQHGPGGMRHLLALAQGHIPEGYTLAQHFAHLADGADLNGRRNRILRDPALSDAPFDPSAPARPEPRTLRRGDAGEDVERLQLALAKAGYLHARRIDGDFGQVTEDAVIAFQACVGLDPDGIYGPATRQALAAALTSQEKPQP